MPTSVYLRSPVAPAAHIAENSPAALFNAGAGGQNFETIGTVSAVFGNDTGVPRAAFYVVLLDTLPAKAKIVSAMFAVLSQDTIGIAGHQISGCLIHAGLVPRDGLWDDESLTFGWNTDSGMDGVLAFRTSGAGVLANTLTTGNSDFWVKGDSTLGGLAGSIEAGQSIRCTSGGVLTSGTLRLRRLGTVTGSLRMRVETCVANDGSDDRPSGNVVDTSSGILASTIAQVAAGTSANFVFSGGQTLTSGTRYAGILESDYAASDVACMRLVCTTGNQFANGRLVAYGVPFRFNQVAYLSIGALPFFYNKDQTTVRVVPYSGFHHFTVPPFTVTGTWYNIGDFTPELQYWVDDPDYLIGEGLAVQLFPDVSGTAGAKRGSADHRLTVTYLDPLSGMCSIVFGASGACQQLRNASGSASIVFGASGAAPQQLVNLSGSASIVWGASGQAQLLTNLQGLASIVFGASGTLSGFNPFPCNWFSAAGDSDWFVDSGASWFTPGTSDWFEEDDC